MPLRPPPPQLAPGELPQKIQKTQASANATAWHDYKVELITPMYGGGVLAGTVDKDFPIRPTAIRGQLRFWWRFLAEHQYRHSPEQIRAEELAVWGGIATNGPSASRIRIRVKQPEQRPIAPWTDYKKKHGSNELNSTPTPEDWANAPYALFPAQGKAGQVAPAALLKETSWNLGVQLRLQATAWQTVDQLKQRFTEALRWWATFGGIGARTRRGLGAIHIKNLTPITAEEARAAGCQLRLAAKHYETAAEAWQDAVQRLRKFRQGENLGRNQREKNSPPGRSRWPEANAIRLITGKHRIKAHRTVSFAPTQSMPKSFPRALFGLPIVFHFQGKNDDHAKDPDDSILFPRNAAGKKLERMASPLILRPYPVDQNIWQPAALLMPSQLPPDSLLVLEYRSKSFDVSPLPPPGSGDQAFPKDCPITRYSNPEAPHPLQAFLQYFEQ